MNNMKRFFFTLLLCSGIHVMAQSLTDTIMVTPEQLTALVEYEEKMTEMLQQLEIPGVRVEGSKMLFSEEAKRLIADEGYRSSVYSEDGYDLSDVGESIAANELQKAFWQMINLYPENKEDVLRYIYAYDGVFPTDKVVTAAFYTYGFFDPRITRIKDGRPDVYRPDLFENYLKNTREIVSYILYFREQNVKDKL